MEENRVLFVFCLGWMKIRRALILCIMMPCLCHGLDHFERLKLLKEKGFKPRVVFDIGAFHGDWSQSMQKIFPRTLFFLFEANPTLSPFLSQAGFPFFIVLLGNEEKIVPFHMNGNTGDSIFLEQTHYFQEGRFETKELMMSRLGSFVKKHHLPLPDLIKMDVQGAEKLIIEASPEIITHAEVVILETQILEYNKGAPFSYEVMTLMNELGYSLLDILELHYIPTGELIQIDLLFVKNDSPLIKRGVLIP